MPLSREEMIGKLQWNDGGYGFGVCEVGAAMIWTMDTPGPDKPDLKSTVAVSGPPDKYTDEELEKILAFSERVTARYDKMFSYRRGANLILLDKPEYAEGRWLRKRLSWTIGPMFSETLDEALAIMEK